MIPLIRLIHTRRGQQQPPEPLRRPVKFFWTLSNSLLLTSLVLGLYVGGLYAHTAYARYAARGDTAVPPLDADPQLARDMPAGAALPVTTLRAHQSTVVRVIIPSIAVDTKVVESGWKTTREHGQPVAIWQVPAYAVGQLRGSANPGEGGNIVLIGHVSGHGQVFRDLFNVRRGDEITLSSTGQLYRYRIQDRLVLTEDGVSAEQQEANMHYIDPTNAEVVTLVTCWPFTGPARYTQRVVVQAVPVGVNPVSPTQKKPVRQRW
jgi:sortase A